MVPAPAHTQTGAVGFRGRDGVSSKFRREQISRSLFRSSRVLSEDQFGISTLHRFEKEIIAFQRPWNAPVGEGNELESRDGLWPP